MAIRKLRFIAVTVKKQQLYMWDVFFEHCAWLVLAKNGKCLWGYIVAHLPD